MRLLSDEVAFDVFRKDQCSDHGMTTLRSQFWQRNVERAEQNLDKEAELKALHKQVNDLQDVLQVGKCYILQRRRALRFL